MIGSEAGIQRITATLDRQYPNKKGSTGTDSDAARDGTKCSDAAVTRSASGLAMSFRVVSFVRRIGALYDHGSHVKHPDPLDWRPKASDPFPPSVFNKIKKRIEVDPVRIKAPCASQLICLTLFRANGLHERMVRKDLKPNIDTRRFRVPHARDS